MGPKGYRNEWRKSGQQPAANVYRIEDGRSGGMSVSTINRRLAAIHGLYEHLMRAEPDRLARNPVPRGQASRSWRGPVHPHRLLGHLGRRVATSPLRLRTPHRLPRGLNPDEVQRLVGSFRTHRDKAMALPMLFGGLRSSEVLMLKVRDVDLAVKTVRVWDKGGRERVVPVGKRSGGGFGDGSEGGLGEGRGRGGRRWRGVGGPARGLSGGGAESLVWRGEEGHKAGHDTGACAGGVGLADGRGVVDDRSARATSRAREEVSRRSRCGGSRTHRSRRTVSDRAQGALECEGLGRKAATGKRPEV